MRFLLKFSVILALTFNLVAPKGKNIYYTKTDVPLKFDSWRLFYSTFINKKYFSRSYSANVFLSMMTNGHSADKLLIESMIHTQLHWYLKTCDSEIKMTHLLAKPYALPIMMIGGHFVDELIINVST